LIPGAHRHRSRGMGATKRILHVEDRDEGRVAARMLYCSGGAVT
jgi:hypothetical protein